MDSRWTKQPTGSIDLRPACVVMSTSLASSIVLSLLEVEALKPALLNVAVGRTHEGIEAVEQAGAPSLFQHRNKRGRNGLCTVTHTLFPSSFIPVNHARSVSVRPCVYVQLRCAWDQNKGEFKV